MKMIAKEEIIWHHSSLNWRQLSADRKHCLFFVVIFLVLDIHPHSPSTLKRLLFPSLSRFFREKQICKPSETHWDLFFCRLLEGEEEENKETYRFSLLWYSVLDSPGCRSDLGQAVPHWRISPHGLTRIRREHNFLDFTSRMQRAAPKHGQTFARFLQSMIVGARANVVWRTTDTSGIGTRGSIVHLESIPGIKSLIASDRRGSKKCFKWIPSGLVDFLFRLR